MIQTCRPVFQTLQAFQTRRIFPIPQRSLSLLVLCRVNGTCCAPRKTRWVFGCWMGGLVLALLGMPLFAQAPDAAATSAAPPAALIEPIKPSATPRAALQTVEIRGRAQRRRPGSVLEPETSLSGAALSDRSSGTLGATLQDELGVANASFGPGVGLPQIRGQGGSRTRVMQGGLGSHDASAISADHAVMAEPALAERITVYRGPAAILYGGSAIGGAVQIDDRRILDSVPLQPEGRAEARVTRDSSFALLRADVGLPGMTGLAEWAAHADLHVRDTRRVRIPGLALDEDAIRQQFGLVNGRNTRGVVGNSDAHIEGGSVGASRVFGNGFIGFNVAALRQSYGLPPGAHSHGANLVAAGIAPDAAADLVRINAEQDRLQVKAEWSSGWAALPTLRVQAMRSLYAHEEVAEGRVDTRFAHRVSEGRLELDTRWGEQISGLLGAHLERRDFSALGDEAFVPRTFVSGGSLFGLQRWQSGAWLVEAGARAEHHRYQPDSPFAVLGQDRSLPPRRFWPRSGSLALRHAHAGGEVTLTHWSVARAPDVQELFAGGPHIATRSFDFGNTALDIERLRGWDLAVEQRGECWRWRSNAFLYRSNSYIYQRALGWYYEAEEKQAQALCARLGQCFPATKYEQQPAAFHGYEVELELRLPMPASLPAETLLTLFSDQVRGTLQPGGDVPRLAPQRYGVAMKSAFGPWRAEWRLTRARAQSRPGLLETPTRASVQLNAGLRYTLAESNGQEWSVFFVGRNLANAEVRNSASFLRSYAPEPGRSVQLGVQWLQ